jgi:hypothetical protein
VKIVTAAYLLTGSRSAMGVVKVPSDLPTTGIPHVNHDWLMAISHAGKLASKITERLSGLEIAWLCCTGSYGSDHCAVA